MVEKPINLNFWIDSSGVPFETTYVGLIISTPQKINLAIKKLNKNCPRLFSKKATKLNHREVYQIISTLNNTGIIMATTRFSSTQWEEYKKEFGLNQSFKEKMLGIVYYNLLSSTQKVFKYFPYIVTTCRESHLNIDMLHQSCKRLAEADKLQFSFSSSTAEFNDGIRLVDYVAHSLRSNKIENLKQLKNLHLIKFQRNERLLKKTFN